MAIAILKKKTIEDAKNLATRAVGSVKTALIIAGVALLVGLIALAVAVIR